MINEMQMTDRLSCSRFAFIIYDRYESLTFWRYNIVPLMYFSHYLYIRRVFEVTRIYESALSLTSLPRKGHQPEG